MGKIFNDDIIKILCAKNLSKIQQDIGEPNLRLKESAELRRSERYVAFLDKKQRKELEQVMRETIADLYLGPGIRSCISSPEYTRKIYCIAERFYQAVYSFRQWICETKYYSDLLQSMCESKFFNYLLPSNCCILASKEEDRMMPPVFGPFLDESVCASLDQLYYCICVMLGYSLKPLGYCES